MGCDDEKGSIVESSSAAAGSSERRLRLETMTELTVEARLVYHGDSYGPHGRQTYLGYTTVTPDGRSAAINMKVSTALPVLVSSTT